MLLSEILRTKGSTVHWTLPTATLDDVVKKLVHHNCGSLVVLTDASSKKMLGIITERDILRVCARGEKLEEIRVESVMTTDVITGVSGDTIESAMGFMTENRIRHLPVVDKGELAGIISIGDVVKAQHDHLKAENHYLKSYIQS